MFDTEKLIHEIKLRDNLWNVSSPKYMNKPARRQAWEEIATIFYADWSDSPYNKREQRLDYIMKKWRNVRDYYMKEIKKEKDQTLGGKKKKKYNFFDSLTFLDTIKRKKTSASGSHEVTQYTEQYLVENSNDTTSDVQCTEEDSLSVSSHYIKQDEEIEVEEEAITSKAMPSFETHILAPLDKSQEEDASMMQKANQNFLLSLLPDVTSLNERQNMRFRLGVLNLLHDIKFGPK